jgi:hypothetical protein
MNGQQPQPQLPKLDLAKLLAETSAARQALAPLLAHPASAPAQPRKKDVLEAMLAHGVAQVQVDPTLPGVDLPEQFLGTSGLALNFSYGYAGHDLQLDDAHLCQTLSFSGTDYRVRVPLRAIVAARSLAKGVVAEFQVFTDAGTEPVEGQDPDLDPDPPPGAA